MSGHLSNRLFMVVNNRIESAVISIDNIRLQRYDVTVVVSYSIAMYRV